MTLPASGSISLSQVNTELGYSSSAQISLNDSAVRTLFGKSSGAISMSDGYGKANQFAFTISSNQTNANLRTLAINAGWNQSSALVATISSGVYISSNSTGTPALTVSGSFPGGVSLTNNGYIVGMGGAGGAGGRMVAGSPGQTGGGALVVSSALTLTNNGTIAGGGGGGGGGGGSYTYYQGYIIGGASGGGGGRSSAASNSAGGAGVVGTNCTGYTGNQGTVSAAGAGWSRCYIVSGGGGNWGASGAAGQYDTSSATNKYPGGSGGGGGYSVSGNGYITWVATGTRLGSIS